MVEGRLCEKGTYERLACVRELRARELWGSVVCESVVCERVVCEMAVWHVWPKTVSPRP